MKGCPSRHFLAFAARLLIKCIGLNFDGKKTFLGTTNAVWSTVFNIQKWPFLGALKAQIIGPNFCWSQTDLLTLTLLTTG